VACICCSGASRTRRWYSRADKRTRDEQSTADKVVKQSMADEKSSQGLTRQDAFKGQRVVACTSAEVNTSMPSECTFSFFIETCGYVRLQCRDL